METKFFIHPSSAGKIMAGEIGLSETQQTTKLELLTRKTENLKGNPSFKPLTKIMEETLAMLLQKEANPTLPAGAKTHCEAWMMEQIYQRRKTFTSKYTERGDISEVQSLEVIRDMFGYNELPKNIETFKNEWVIGTPDAITEDCIIDAKSPWSCFSFPLFETKCPEPDYYWQAQAYMDLIPGKELFRLCYVLIDMPESLIINEAKNWCFKNGEQFRPEVVEEMREMLTYKNIDDKFKRKVFEIPKDNDAIAALHVRVDMCRNYIATFDGFEN